MPPRDVYIEPIPGGGAIMKRKPLAVCNLGIDPDHGATQWLHVLTDGSPALEFLRRKRGRCGCSRQGPPGEPALSGRGVQGARQVQHSRPKSPFLHIHLKPAIKVRGQADSRRSGRLHADPAHIKVVMGTIG
ncbi:MAG: hypothetical protein F4103_10480 [Boseongicola sp. SB0673_bin_14]|nr:hypothetical protein [Boseongicola sp. SB0673_bin_14]